MPYFSREKSFDRHLSFDTRSELNTATLPRDSQSAWRARAPRSSVYIGGLGT